MIKINIDFFRQNVIEYACTFLDKKYVWDSKGPDEFDCSGFTWYVFHELFNVDINENGYGIGDTTKQMTSNIGNLKVYKEDDVNKLKYIKEINPGDLVFFHRQSMEDDSPTPTNRYPGHVGIYIGNNKFIHASSDDGKIIISDFDNYWVSVLVASKDIVSDILKKQYGYKDNDIK